MQNPIGAPGAIALAESTGVSNLEVLDLGGAGVGDDGAIAIASAPWLASVRYLDLSDNDLTDRGVLAIARSPFAGVSSTSLSPTAESTRAEERDQRRRDRHAVRVDPAPRRGPRRCGRRNPSLPSELRTSSYRYRRARPGQGRGHPGPGPSVADCAMYYRCRACASGQ